MYSALVPPLVHRFKDLPEEEVAACEIADVVRCRRNALLYNVHSIPVFCPLDQIQPRSEHKLGDLNFVTKSYTNLKTRLGYTGPGWQHRCLTEWLLYSGVIGWDHVSHTFTATSNLPADLFVRPLLQMENAWPSGSIHAKRSINSLIGLWCLDEPVCYTVITSNHDGDCPQGATKRTVHFEGGVTQDFITSTKLLSSTSWRPLHDLALSTEAVRVGQMLYCLRQQRATIYECKTDSVLYKPLKRRKRTCYKS